MLCLHTFGIRTPISRNVLSRRSSIMSYPLRSRIQDSDRPRNVVTRYYQPTTRPLVRSIPSSEGSVTGHTALVSALSLVTSARPAGCLILSASLSFHLASIDDSNSSIEIAWFPIVSGVCLSATRAATSGTADGRGRSQLPMSSNEHEHSER